MSNITEEVFSYYKGSEKTFILNEKQLVVPAGMDAYMFYRRKFWELAKACAGEAAAEYRESVHDLVTFFDNFVDIYNKYLKQIIGKAIDVLVSFGIYNVSVDNFMKEHQENFHNIENDLQVLVGNMEQVVENNANVTRGVMNIAGSLFGVQGDFFDGVVEGTAENVSKLNDSQQAEFFKTINPTDLFNRAFYDYWNVYFTLATVLKYNGEDIWLFDDSDKNSLDAILQNISNPNFPQEKVLDILFDCILKNPIDETMYKILEEKCGLTDELNTIFDYFLYPVFTQPMFSEDDFPKTSAESLLPEANLSQERGNEKSAQETEYNQQTQEPKKGIFSEKMKKGLMIGAGLFAAGAMMNAAKGVVNRGNEKFNYRGTSSCQIGKKGQYGIASNTYTNCSGCPLQNKCAGYK